MKKVTCLNCKHSKFMAGIGAGLSKLMGAPPHPYPTHTCQKYGITRRREKYEIQRLPVCIKENGGEKKEATQAGEGGIDG